MTNELSPANLTHQPQMTLRDYFAAAAITGILANPENNTTYRIGLASKAYDIADSLLSARFDPI